MVHIMNPPGKIQMPSRMPDSHPSARNGLLPLLLGTVSFAVCFAAWGLIAAFAPRFRDTFHLSATQAALMVAVPVLLGSLARLPVGMLADRFGGRLVFSLLMLLCAVPAFLTPMAKTYQQLLLGGFFLGLAGSSFAVGVGFVARWFNAEKQGGALGVYGLGNIGQSAAVFLGPLLAITLGWQNIFRGMAVMLVVWAVVFWVLARNAPVAVRPKAIGEMFGLLAREKLSWALSAFYFLTFGGFVAFSIYLPSLLRDQFHLQPADAGFRTAGFVVLATLLRPVGGWLSDRIGGARVLSVVFSVVIPFALLLAWPSILPFTIGALGCAVLMGLGNGAVFKLVPQYFPRETGTVTGLVGAMGGLGGFFPPLLLGFFRDRIGYGVARLCSAGAGLPFDVANQCACLHPTSERTGSRVACTFDSRRGLRPCRRLGDAMHAAPRRRHRRGFAQSGEFRPSAGDLYIRDHLRYLGRGLSLQRLAG